MGEILGAAVIVLILIAVIAGGVYYLMTSQQEREASTEVVTDALTPRAVRVLDRLLSNPEAVYMMNEADRKEAQEIVNAFYSH